MNLFNTMNNINKTKQLIREGKMGTQDKFIEIMMEIKRKNPGLTHEEVVDLVQSEFDRFLQFHKKDRTELPSTNKDVRVFRDKMPMMRIPYGKNKKGF